MSVDTFKPEVWSAVLLASLKKSLVYGGLANHDYEGEIASRRHRHGQLDLAADDRHVRAERDDRSRPSSSRPRSASSSSTRRSTSRSGRRRRRPPGARRAAPGCALSEAGYGLADVADQFIAGLYTGVQSANALGTSRSRRHARPTRTTRC
jgi:hypothetical protein